MNKHAKYWFCKIESESEVFNKFICAWISFNSVYGIMSEKRDKAQVDDWARENQHMHEELMNNDGDYNRHSKLICEYEIPKKSGGKKSTVKCSDEMNLTEVMSSVYQIRCNLFHGRKEAGDITDDNYVTTALVIISKLLTRLNSTCNQPMSHHINRDI